MKVVAVENAGSLAACVRQVNKEPLVVTRAGKPIAALVRVANADIETAALSSDPKFLALIERSRARQRSEGGLSTAQVRRRLGLKPSSRKR